MFDRLRRLRDGVRRTHESFFGRIAGLFSGRPIDEALWIDLEELLISADVGVTVAEQLVEILRDRVEREGMRDGARARAMLQEELVALLRPASGANALSLAPGRLNIVVVVGVNGSGKTTSIAKLAHYLKSQGHQVTLGAADTFRAAAIDQLKVWGERVGVPVIAHQPGADPGAVVYDAIEASRARGSDVLIVDTAGRLHTKFNLMEELKKVIRIAGKRDPTAPHEVLLVLDATTGQNALAQAQHFTKAVGVTGLILAKLDGTAKGGAVFAIADELELPIKFIGTGERLGDIAPFDPESYVQALFTA
jgi:fused signal recognition particle receptor